MSKPNSEQELPITRITVDTPGRYEIVMPNGIEINVIYPHKSMSHQSTINGAERPIYNKRWDPFIKKFRDASRMRLISEVRFLETSTERTDWDYLTSESSTPDAANTQNSISFSEAAEKAKIAGIPSWVLRQRIREARLNLPFPDGHMDEAPEEAVEAISRMEDEIDQLYEEGEYAPKK